MVKKFFKMAGVTNENDFYAKYPTEEAFLNSYPEAYMMMYGGAYKGGGGTDNPGFRALPEYVQHKIISNMAYGGYYQEGGEQMAPQGGGSQQEQVVQFIVQALQQGAQPNQIVAELAKAGIPEEQGMQLVTAVVQRMQEMQQQAGPGAGQMGQEQAQQQFEQASMQAPEYEEQAPQAMKQGGSYQIGGDTTNRQFIKKSGMSDFLDYYPKGQEFNYMSNNYDTNKNKELRERAKNFYKQGAPATKGRSGPGMFLRPGIYNEARSDWFDDAAGTENFTEEMFDNWKESVRNKPYYRSGGNSSDGTYYQGTYFKGGGSTRKYKRGGEYEMSQKEIQDLINKGYKIKYL